MAIDDFTATCNPFTRFFCRKQWKGYASGSRETVPGKENGFTLLEILVAVSIIVIVLVAVYRLHAQTISMNISARFYSVAPLLAQEKIAEIQLKKRDELFGDSGGFGEAFPGYKWELEVRDMESEYLEELSENLKRIDLHISYNDGEYNYNARTYKYFYNE
jgi:general secretion pathway protein I